MKKFVIYCCLAAAMPLAAVRAQVPAFVDAEKKLVETFAASRAAWDDYEKKELLAEEFEAGLRALLADPRTLEHPFDLLGETIEIVTASDGLLRTYAWNDGLGGPYGNGGGHNIIQFVNPSGRVVLTSHERASRPDDWDEEGMMWDSGGFEIYTVNIHNSETRYLIESSGTKMGAMWGNRSIQAFSAGEDNLIREQLFNTGKKRLYDISIDRFDTTEPYDEDLFKFDPATKTVYVPLVNADYKVTSNYLIYRWDGLHFLYRGTGKVSPPIAEAVKPAPAPAPPAAVSAPAVAYKTVESMPSFDWIPIDQIHYIHETCLVEIWPENREFEDEDSEEAADYYSVMDDLAWYMSETRTRLEGMGVGRVRAQKRYLSFTLDGGANVVDTKSIEGYSALLYKRNHEPIYVDIVSPVESGIEDYLALQSPTAPAAPSMTIVTTAVGSVDIFRLCGRGKATIDWGDGSAPQTVELTKEDTQLNHTYAEAGEKSVTISGDVTSLTASEGPFVSIDAGGMPGLKYLNCYYEGVVSLDVAGCAALEQLYCSENALTSLDITGCTALKILFCDFNDLTSLDIAGCPALKELYCNENALASLDLSGCPALEQLYCSENALASLDLSGCPALKELSCDNNALTSLDISRNGALEQISFYYSLLDADAIRAVFAALPDRTGRPEDKVCYIMCHYPYREQWDYKVNPVWESLTDADKAIAGNKGWRFYAFE